MSIGYLNKLLKVLGDNVIDLIPVFLLWFLISFFDVLGLSLLGAFIAFFVSVAPYESFLVRMINAAPMIMDTQVYNMSLYLILIYLCRAGISVYGNYRVISFCAKLSASIKVKLISKYYDYNFDDFLRQKPSHYTYLVTNAAQALGTNILVNFIKMINDAIVITSIVIFLGYVDLGLLLTFFLFFGALFLVVSKLTKKTIYRAGEQTVFRSKNLLTQMRDFETSIREAKILKRENFFKMGIANTAYQLAHAQLLYNWLNTLPRIILELGLMIFFVIAIVVNFDDSTVFPLSNFAIFAAGAFRIVPMMSQFAASLNTVRHHTAQLDDLYVDFVKEQNVTFAESFDEISDFRVIEMSNVTFSHHGSEKKLIQNASLEILKGDIVGLIGSSGSGKSTLLDLVLGLLKPNDGKVILNYNELTSHNSWGDIAMYVPQNSVIIDGSYALNVSFKDDLSDDEIARIQEVSALAMLDRSLNMESTNILSNSMRLDAALSGGEKQRLAIARALFMDKQFLVLDEATSAIDHPTQKILLNNILGSRKDLTCIIVTHDHKILEFCNKIITLEDGKVEVHQRDSFLSRIN